MSEWTNWIIGRDGHLQIRDERAGWLGEAACSIFSPLSPRFASHLDKERWGGFQGLRRGEEDAGSKGGDIIALVVLLIVIHVDVVVVVAIIVVVIIISISITRWRIEGWKATLHLRETARVGWLSSTAETTLSYSLVALSQSLSFSFGKLLIAQSGALNFRG